MLKVCLGATATNSGPKLCCSCLQLTVCSPKLLHNTFFLIFEPLQKLCAPPSARLSFSALLIALNRFLNVQGSLGKLESLD